MARRPKPAPPPSRQLAFAIEDELAGVDRDLKPMTGRFWSSNKAELVRDYLKLFTFVTKSGTYLDAFAGPQNSNELEAWCARLVTEMKPRWIGGLYLFEQKASSAEALEEMLSRQPPRDVAKRESKC
jgi:hypothetical protein